MCKLAPVEGLAGAVAGSHYPVGKQPLTAVLGISNSGKALELDFLESEPGEGDGFLSFGPPPA